MRRAQPRLLDFLLYRRAQAMRRCIYMFPSCFDFHFTFWDTYLDSLIVIVT